MSFFKIKTIIGFLACSSMSKIFALFGISVNLICITFAFLPISIYLFYFIASFKLLFKIALSSLQITPHINLLVKKLIIDDSERPKSKIFKILFSGSFMGISNGTLNNAFIDLLINVLIGALINLVLVNSICLLKISINLYLLYLLILSFNNCRPYLLINSFQYPVNSLYKLLKRS